MQVNQIFFQFLLAFLLISVPIDSCVPTSSASNPVISTTQTPTSTTEVTTESSTTVTDTTTESTSTTEMPSTTENGLCLQTNVSLSLGNNDDLSATIQSTNYVPSTATTSATMTVICSTTSPTFYVKMEFVPTASPNENEPGFPKTVSVNLFCNFEIMRWSYRVSDASIIPVDSIVCTPERLG